LPSPNNTTVFVHSGWRCSSTYVWHRFRALAGVRAYYEPWHEQLARITADTIHAETPDNSGLRHPGGTEPYLKEFEVVLDPAGGVRGFEAGFALDRFWIEPEASDLGQQAYVQGLVDAARQRDETPILACCRTLGRVGWLKRRFGGFHVMLVRDPVQQWLSFYSLRKRPRPTYFEQCHYVLMSEMAGYEDVSRTLLCHDFGREGGLDQRLAAVRSRLKRAPASVSFQAFLAVWLASYLKALPQADLVVDVDRLARDQAYARQIEAAIEAGCGLKPDFSDCRAPAPHGIAPPVQWRKAAREVVDLMDLHGAIVGPDAHPILFRKLAPAFAALTPAPVGLVTKVRESLSGLVGGAALARAPAKAYAAAARTDGSRR
jgi:hypothetical protein